MRSAPPAADAVAAIMAAADERDGRAEVRDRAADEREKAAVLRTFLGASEPVAHDELAVGLGARRCAALDRIDAATDRASAASDRAQLDVHRREGDDRLRSLVDAVTQYAIITLTPDGVIESWNTGAERLKGYTAEDALGRHFSLFYRAEDRAAGLPQGLLDRARAEGSCEHTGWRVRRDGTLFWGDIIISALHDHAGKVTGFVKVTRDMSEQHRLEVAQDSFYHAFEHDFRVPITAVKGFTELLSDADPEERSYLVERVDANVDRLLTMVEDLIDYASRRSGRIPISLQGVQMMPLARLALANLASIAETTRVRLTCAGPVEVLADPVALERVVANLVTNALKYSPAGSEIDLVCESIDDVGVLRISDQGRGIDKRDLSKIFLEFERGRLAQDDSGTGLGLTSVERLVGLQHGTVAITSQVGVGTTVTVRLPLAP